MKVVELRRYTGDVKGVALNIADNQTVLNSKWFYNEDLQSWVLTLLVETTER